MDSFVYRDGTLFAEDVSCVDLAQRFGTPCYVYSRAAIESRWRAWDEALSTRPHLICYSVKANSNLGVLSLLARLGSGFDIVSGGELARVIAAGGDPRKVVFSGVGKRVDEIAYALECNIRCFNVESLAELDRINEVAIAAGVRASVSLRVNPDVDADTHPYIATGLAENKFGIAIDEAGDAYRQAMDLSNITVVGIDCHIGSQMTDIAPWVEAVRRVIALVVRLRDEGITIDHFDIGGGLGIAYEGQSVPVPADLVRALDSELPAGDLEIMVEPGRSIVGETGILLTTVEYLKTNSGRHFAIVDAAMTELMRPSLYDAWHDIVAVQQRSGGQSGDYDIVGPVCESGDFLGKGRALQLTAGDLLAIRDAGAYGFVMSSNYNTRPRPPEIMVDGDQVVVVRERESVESLFSNEHTVQI